MNRTATKPAPAAKPRRTPAMGFTTSDEVRALRKKLGLNQSEFWVRLGVTQSGGSRYESGRNIPESVRVLLNLAYGAPKRASELFDWLRTPR